MGKLIFETKRLLLREFQASDRENLGEILSDPEVMKFSSMGVLRNDQLEQNLLLTIAKYQETGAGFWAVIDKESKELIGRIGLPYLELDGEKFYEVAFRVRKKSWGKGFGTEAALGCAAFAFEQLNQNFVRSIIHPENGAAIRVAERIGMAFEKEGIFHETKVLVFRLNRRSNLPH